VPNPRQPRRFFDSDALRGLAVSIRKVGLLEDILVRPSGEKYEIVLGERRWRASQLAGLDGISAKVVALDDEEVRLLAITENVQRENLSKVEEAFSFKQYVDEGALITSLGDDFGGFGDRIAERLKVLNSHHYVEFQQERINELTEAIERLRAQVVTPEQPRFDVQIASGDGVLALLQAGFELAVALGDGRFAMRRRVD
jgi:ParB family chromosome partitioning protein